ncbi:MAG TPA: amino acid permease, partial [Pirellulaceae bacterium]|nr:amino acid permease [Pirellulaceae bacterium]
VFCNATAVQAGAMGVIAIVCVNNLNLVVGGAEWSPSWVLVLSIALIGTLTLANLAGVKWGSRIQNFTVAAKLAALGLVIVLGIGWAPSPAPDVLAPTSSLAPSAWGFMAAIVPTIFAYGGWQHALWLAGEVRNPSKVVPRAIMIGVAIVIVTYLSANWAYFRLLSLPEVASSKSLAADALAKVTWFGAWGRWWIALAVCISAFGVLNAQLLSGPRLIQGMARDFQLFSIFANCRGPSAAPVAAIVLLGCLSAGLLVLAGENGLGKLTTGVVFVDGIFFALTGLALIGVRRAAAGDITPAFRTPWYPWIPLLFSAGMFGVVIGSFANADVRSSAVIGILWILGAIAIYGVGLRLRKMGQTSK